MEYALVEEVDVAQDAEVLRKEIIQISKKRKTLVRKKTELEKKCLSSSRNLKIRKISKLDLEATIQKRSTSQVTDITNKTKPYSAWSIILFTDRRWRPV